MSFAAGSDTNLVPTVADIGLTFPVAVLSIEDAARLAGQRLVVLVATDDKDPASGIPLTVYAAHHGEGVLAWSLLAFVQLLEEDRLGEDVDSLLDDYPAYIMCGYRIAEMLLGPADDPIDRRLLLKMSSGLAVFLDTNDLRLIRHSAHDPASCGCAPGRMVPLMGVIESLMADSPIPE